MIGQLLDEVQPDTILTFGPDGMTFHPDHIAVSPLGDRRLAAARPPGPPALRHVHRRATSPASARLYEEWGVYMTDERPTGVPADELAVHVVLDGAQLDRKLDRAARRWRPRPAT